MMLALLLELVRLTLPFCGLCKAQKISWRSMVSSTAPAASPRPQNLWQAGVSFHDSH